MGVGRAEHSLVAALVSGHLGDELCVGHVGELVDRHGVGVLAGVVLADRVQVCLEDGVAGEELIRSVALGVVLHERSELQKRKAEAERERRNKVKSESEIKFDQRPAARRSTIEQHSEKEEDTTTKQPMHSCASLSMAM